MGESIGDTVGRYDSTRPIDWQDGKKTYIQIDDRGKASIVRLNTLQQWARKTGLFYKGTQGRRLAWALYKERRVHAFDNLENKRAIIASCDQLGRKVLGRKEKEAPVAIPPRSDITGGYNETKVSESRRQLTKKEGAGEIWLVKGNITEDVDRREQVKVNAANAKLQWGGGGTNRAFSNIYPKDQWSKAARSYFAQRSEGEKRSVTALKPGEVMRMQLEGKDLIQALGPVVKDARDFPEAQQIVFHAYMEIFREAQKAEHTSVQLPLLSAGIFSDSLPPEEKALWVDMVKDAAMHAADMAMNQGLIQRVVFVDKDQVPT